MSPVPKHLRKSRDGITGRGMMFSEDTQRISENGFTPRYLRIANDISKRIFDGEYRPGEQLPPMRLLSKRYGVSTQVIFSALQGLMSIRYLEKRPGHNGIYISSDLKPARFYRIAVFIINQNPLVYSAILYPMYLELEKLGYTMILGMNFDKGLTLKQWISHKRNMDGLIIVGTPQPKDLSHFTKINIPYLFLATQKKPDLYGFVPQEEMNLFVNWFTGSYIKDISIPEERPIYLFEQNPLHPLTLPQEWADYEAKKIYGLQRLNDGTMAVRSAEVQQENNKETLQ